MKTLFSKAKLTVAIVVFCVTVNLSYAQFNMQANGLNRWGRLNPIAGFNATAIGIGTFTSPTQPLSTLHINTNGLGNPFYGAGEVFRTTGPAGNTNAWRMFTGTGAGTEKFSVSALASSNNVNLTGLAAEDEIRYRQAQIQFVARNWMDVGINNLDALLIQQELAPIIFFS